MSYTARKSPNMLTVSSGFPFTGQVVRVIDGDTIEVLHNGNAEQIRLHGIDCPENGQAFGMAAKLATSALVFAKSVTVERQGSDKGARASGAVLLSDGRHVNHELVANGWCWWYPTYGPEDLVLVDLEKAARVAHKGLWTDPSPVPPWEWRKRGQVMRKNE